jgi:hypothetical protein
MSTIDFPDGGYEFIPGVFQYSAGVRALPGHCIERVRFARPVPMAEGFAHIATYLSAMGRPRTAFCACELRSPAPFTEEGFRAFNEAYAAVLGEWGLLPGGRNPVARSNVCPEVNPPSEPSFHAFSFTTRVAEAPPSFVVAGSGEVPEGKANYRDFITAPGDTSADGMRAKIRFVMTEMERRMAALQADWSHTTAAQIYTVENIHPFIATELLARGAGAHGLTWHYDRPPVVGLDYEMDCRGVHVESVLPV